MRGDARKNNNIVTPTVREMMLAKNCWRHYKTRCMSADARKNDEDTA